VGRGHAFILAVGANTHCLKETHRDARDFATAMQGLFNVPVNRTCVLDNAYRHEFVPALERLAQVAKSDDLVIIYYSGHGTKLDDEDGDETDGDKKDEAFVPVSVKPRKKYLLIDDDFSTLIGAIPTENILTVIDACFSASLTKLDRTDKPSEGPLKFLLWPWGNSNVDEPVITHVGDIDDVKGVLLSAAREGENARELPGRGGRFTVFFLEELKKARSAQNVDLLAVFEKTRDRVSHHSREEQMPVAKGEEALFERINRFIVR